MSDGRRKVGEKLHPVEEEVRRESPHEGESSPTSAAAPMAPQEALPPSGAEVNEAWRATPRSPGGLGGVVFRLLDRLLRRRFEAQQAFNARQVQLDNDILRHIEERFTATHRHYDELLGARDRHLEEIDERHRLLQKDLVRTVDDLVSRIDLVLERGERSRLSLEHELRDVRHRLERISASLGGS